MTTFTIDTDNNITAHATLEDAAAATTTPFDTFTSEQELAELAKAWPAERLVAIWNSLPGVKPVKKFKDAATAASRIWERIQGLGEATKPETATAKPKAGKKAKGGAKSAQGASAKGKASGKATAAKKSAPAAAKPAPKGKGAKADSDGPRAGSKSSHFGGGQ
jgi:hypothetical protein